MFSTSWQQALRRTLDLARPTDRPPRVAIVGVGHDLRGDDAVGPRIVAAMRRVASDSCLVLDGGTVPESWTGTLRHFAPDVIIMVDAVDMRALPGTVRWYDDWLADAPATSTHTLPLDVIASLWRAELRAQVGLLGLQPVDTTLDRPLSPALSAAVEHVSRGLVALLQPPPLLARPAAPSDARTPWSS